MAAIVGTSSNGTGLMKHDLEAALKQAAGCGGGGEVSAAPRLAPRSGDAREIRFLAPREHGPPRPAPRGPAPRFHPTLERA
jgi:hypothetical protein